MFYARKDEEGNLSQYLHEHLQGVTDYCEIGFFNQVSFENLDNNSIEKAIMYSAYLHDLGKYTEYFQDYLQHGTESPYSNHAHISALYLFQSLRETMKITNPLEYKNVLAYLAYISVARHHGNLSLINYSLPSYYAENTEQLKIQSSNLVKKIDEIFADSLLSKYISYESFKNFSKFDFREIQLQYMYQLITTRLINSQWYFLLLYIFSLLIDNDKMDSAQVTKKLVRSLPYHAVVDFIKSNSTGKATINIQRTKARNQVMSAFADYTEIEQQKFFTLTAPTGLGKTLLSLEFAINLQQRTKGYTPRIINAIPFINIIEQTSNVFNKVLPENTNIVIHHRLAEFKNKVEENESVSLDKTLLEVEAWEGDVILTTFVQLFHSILTGKNKALKKLNKMAGAIVILDEVQSIPDNYMALLGAVLIKISQYYGTRFILMTATQPYLLEAGYRLLNQYDNYFSVKESIELLPDNNEYFVQLKRTKLIPLLEKSINNEEFINLFIKHWNYRDSVLIVVNTIKRSIDIYEMIKEKLGNKISEDHIDYLSTNIIPKQRKQVIQNAKRILKNNNKNRKGNNISLIAPYILVSTQTIEAGVDLDFDMAFRAVAPLESIIQTAGRVNREGENGEYRPVFITRLGHGNEHVYNLNDINLSLKTLKNYIEIKEPQYHEIIDNYYKSKLSYPLPSESIDIWENGIKKLDFDKIEEFELIKNTDDIIDVFVEFDDYAVRIADAYEELKINKENINVGRFKDIVSDKELALIKAKLSIQEYKALMRLVLAKLNNYIISVRYSRLKNNIPPKFSDRNSAISDLLYIPYTQLSNYYDYKTGFKDEQGEAYIF